ncbi:hypothetical protein [Pseudomonas donghuensis]|uniref:hypothetical protein n=1 Tax=Pseudomonas donghuensis TaxID=1163398 RepID=UPI0020C44DFE|nr:hypothetical protein [Pseudomonas donghuensis]MCP6698284.1 hypothetical protein [Pseudomonas donghuensis]
MSEKMSGLKLVRYEGESHSIKLRRYFDLVSYLNKHDLWDKVKENLNYTGEDFQRVVIDTVLLNAVKVAVHQHASDNEDALSDEDGELARATILCARRHIDADARDRANEEKRWREICRSQGTC